MDPSRGDVPVGLDDLLFPNRAEITTWHKDYVSELVTFSPAKIAVEPSRLEKERANLERESKDLAFQHYRTFIKSATCTSDIKSEVQSVLQDVATLESHIPNLSTACHSFAVQAKEITQKRKVHYTTLEQHSTILELLELPQLMDACVKNQCYDDALELEHYARKIYRENLNIPILAQILAEIELSTESMAVHLHNQLCSQCTLTESFKIVNYLRKLAIYNEIEIRVAFLQCKGQYLAHLLQQIPRGNYFMTISKMVDTTRSEMQDIINQYTTLFGDDLKLEKEVSGAVLATSVANILYSWSLCKISEFLERLQSSLSKVKEGSFLANILASCMFFGKNMARLGLDFRGLLPPIFESVVKNIFEKDLDRAVSNFGTHLRKYRNLTAHQGLSEYTPKLDDTQDNISPPIILLDFPPLAILTNVILSTLNDLRTCWLQSMQVKLGKILFTFLSSIIQKLFEHRTQNINVAEPEELSLFLKMCFIASSELLPFIVNCFSTIFGSPNQKLIELSTLQNQLQPLLKERENL